MSMISRMRARNHGSKAVMALISSLVKPVAHGLGDHAQAVGGGLDRALVMAARSGAP